MNNQAGLSEQSSNASTPQELAPGLLRYWLYDGQIVVYKATAISRQVVDSWIASVKDVMAAWPSTQPYLVIHDFRDHNIALTPYARARSEELIKVPVGVPGYAAILLPRNFVATIIRLFMRVQKSGGIDNQLFFDYEEGLSWLKSKMGRLHSN